MNKKRSFMGGAISALAIGVIYLGIGLLWLTASLGFIPLPFPGGLDAISAIALCVNAIVFLSGFRPLSRGEREGFAFIAVGIVLAMVLFVLQLFIMATNFLGWTLGFQDWADWNILTDITPNVWLFLVILVIAAFAHRFLDSPWIFNVGGLSYA
ncbi:MAG: hypothetical protein EAX95_07675 [Candidatus Thorarchaeota archaeon]|nr:hypothetical protein [Candidatus Thorarchaeota archaeon]